MWGNGVTLEPNRGDGVAVQNGANGNTIGVASVKSFQLSNVISGNLGNVVAANYIGTDVSGRARWAT